MAKNSCAELESICPDPARAEVRPARVVGSMRTGWRVQEDSGSEYSAKCAVSCLLRPQAGDRVLVSGADGSPWILSILTREQDGIVIETKGPLTLRSNSSDVSLDAAGAVDLHGRRGLSIQTPAMEVRAATADVKTGSASWLGERFEGRFGAIRMVGKVLESVVDRFRQRARHSDREVSALDRVRSGHIDYQAEYNLSLTGDNVFGSARNLVSIDGEQIHLG